MMQSTIAFFFNNPNSPSLTLVTCEVFKNHLSKNHGFTFSRKAFSQPDILIYLIPFKISVATAILSSFFAITFSLNLHNKNEQKSKEKFNLLEVHFAKDKIN